MAFLPRPRAIVATCAGTPTQSLSSDGYRAIGGALLQFGPLISGEIGGGFSSQRLESNQIGTVEGPAYHALLTWSPLRTLDVWFKAEEIVTQVSDTSVSAVRANAVQLGIDYELLRNVVLSAAGWYEVDNFFGQPREDKVYSARAELRVNPLNRHGSVGIRYDYTERDSNIPINSYDKHEVRIHGTARI